LALRHAGLLADLLERRGPAQALLQVHLRLPHVPVAVHQRPTDPQPPVVLVAEPLVDLTGDVRHREGRELRASLRVEPLARLPQSDQRHLLQVLVVLGLDPPLEPARHEVGQLHVLFEPALHPEFPPLRPTHAVGSAGTTNAPTDPTAHIFLLRSSSSSNTPARIATSIEVPNNTISGTLSVRTKVTKN